MNRTERFGLILSTDEKSALSRLAETLGGLSQAATLRHLLRHAAKERGIWPLTAQLPDTPEQVSEEVTHG